MKPNTIILILAIVVIGLFLLFKFKKPANASTGEASDVRVNGDEIDLNTTSASNDFSPPTNDQLKSIFTEIKSIYGPTMAKWVEQIYRFETGHFKSGQYLKTGSPGMLAFGESYPYGWKSPVNLWDSDINSRPVKIVPMIKNGKTYNYLGFSNVLGAAKTVAEHIKKYGRPGRWNSTDPVQMSNYENKLRGITTQFT